MNPDRIYRAHRDDALADQRTAAEYSTFVAMPFNARYSYNPSGVLRDVIQAAAERVNELERVPRRFGVPRTVGEPGSPARVITEEIVVRILEAHFFVADLTFENPGVVLETGVALGLKPNNQIVLLTQGSLADLHFDIRNNNVIRYDESGSLDLIAEALIAAATSFEQDCHKHIRSITQRLSPDATLCLNSYGRMHRDQPGVSLHRGNMGHYLTGPNAEFLFAFVASELTNAGLLWTEYTVGKGSDSFGMHPTALGWAVIEELWPDLRR